MTAKIQQRFSEQPGLLTILHKAPKRGTLGDTRGHPGDTLADCSNLLLIRLLNFSGDTWDTFIY